MIEEELEKGRLFTAKNALDAIGCIGCKGVFADTQQELESKLKDKERYKLSLEDVCPHEEYPFRNGFDIYEIFYCLSDVKKPAELDMSKLKDMFDTVKIGSTCVFGDTLVDVLKGLVAKKYEVLKEVNNDAIEVFRAEDGTIYTLCYLIEEPKPSLTERLQELANKHTLWFARDFESKAVFVYFKKPKKEDGFYLDSKTTPDPNFSVWVEDETLEYENDLNEMVLIEPKGCE